MPETETKFQGMPDSGVVYKINNPEPDFNDPPVEPGDFVWFREQSGRGFKHGEKRLLRVAIEDILAVRK